MQNIDNGDINNPGIENPYTPLARNDTFIYEQEQGESAKGKLMLTKFKNWRFYFKAVLVSILLSLYYCMILSMDDEIDLVTSKIFQSMLILCLTSLELVLGITVEITEAKHSRKKMGSSREAVGCERNTGPPSKTLCLSPFTEDKFTAGEKMKKDHSLLNTMDLYKSGSRDNELLEEANYEDKYYIDTKEVLFYDVIFGMISFTSELLLYYLLSLSASLKVNIGTTYSLIVIQFSILLFRLPYFFKISLGIFQIFFGFIVNFSILVLIVIYYIPKYSFFVLIGSVLTISLFKFIQYSIYEYIHNKTRNANKVLREGNMIDGLIGFLLMCVILISKKSEWLIHDLNNLMKVVLASVCYYFALKIMTFKEKHYYFFLLFTSFNFIFISIFDVMINGSRSEMNLFEFLLMTILSSSTILSFVKIN